MCINDMIYLLANQHIICLLQNKTKQQKNNKYCIFIESEINVAFK